MATLTYPTSLSSIAPGWKGGKLPPLGGSLGEYSLNDFDEQPAHTAETEGKKRRDLEEIWVTLDLARSNHSII